MTASSDCHIGYLRLLALLLLGLGWVEGAPEPKQSDQVRYFAQMAVGGDYVTAFVIDNPNLHPIQVRVSLHSSTGDLLEMRVESLGGGETRRLDFQREGSTPAAGWAELRSAYGFTASEQVQHGTSPWVSFSASTPVSGFKVAGKVNTPKLRTGVAIANPDPLESTQVSAVLRNQEGQEVLRTSFQLGPSGHRSG